MVDIIGASFNIYKHTPDAEAVIEIARLQDRYPNLTFAGLQEIDWDITTEKINGWDFYQGEGYARKDPIIWNPDDWPIVVTEGHKILNERFIKDDGSVLPERNAVWVVLEGPLGRIAIINVHLHSDVEGPAGIPNGTIQQELHFESLKGLIEVADSLELLYECPVVVTGDFNVDYSADKEHNTYYFPYRQMVVRNDFDCVWELGEQPTRTNDPYGSRTIDYAYGRGVQFTRVRTPNKWDDNTPINSDHLPVIFDFVME